MPPDRLSLPLRRRRIRSPAAPDIQGKRARSSPPPPQTDPRSRLAERHRHQRSRHRQRGRSRLPQRFPHQSRTVAPSRRSHVPGEEHNQRQRSRLRRRPPSTRQVIPANGHALNNRQKVVVSRSAKLRAGPIALPEKSPPKSITFTTLLRFCPSACSCTLNRSDLYTFAPAETFT